MTEPTRPCSICGEPIHPDRLEALPNTTTCTAHSQVQARTGFMIPTASKGCAPELAFIPQTKEAQRLAERAHKRRR